MLGALRTKPRHAWRWKHPGPPWPTLPHYTCCNVPHGTYSVDSFVVDRFTHRHAKDGPADAYWTLLRRNGVGERIVVHLQHHYAIRDAMTAILGCPKGTDLMVNVSEARDCDGQPLQWCKDGTP